MLIEYDRFVVIHEDAAIEMPCDRARKHRALDVAPLANEICGCVAMRDANDVLFDDRTLVQVEGCVVCRCADSLDSASVGLVIGTATLEGGEE